MFGDLREAGETCGKHRVARIMREHRIKALRGYKAPRHIAGRPSLVAPNRLQRQFTVSVPDQAWVTDITYLRTWQGWLYLAVMIDLYSRKVVGWSMKPTLARELVIDALLMAMWRRKPAGEVIVHSDQGSQGGFNRSMQHRVDQRILGSHSALQSASSSPTFCVACCSRSVPRLESLAHST